MAEGGESFEIFQEIAQLERLFAAVSQEQCEEWAEQLEKIDYDIRAIILEHVENDNTPVVSSLSLFDIRRLLHASCLLGIQYLVYLSLNALVSHDLAIEQFLELCNFIDDLNVENCSAYFYRWLAKKYTDISVRADFLHLTAKQLRRIISQLDLRAAKHAIVPVSRWSEIPGLEGLERLIQKNSELAEKLAIAPQTSADFVLTSVFRWAQETPGQRAFFLSGFTFLRDLWCSYFSCGERSSTIKCFFENVSNALKEDLEHFVPRFVLSDYDVICVSLPSRSDISQLTKLRGFQIFREESLVEGELVMLIRDEYTAEEVNKCCHDDFDVIIVKLKNQPGIEVYVVIFHGRGSARQATYETLFTTVERMLPNDIFTNCLYKLLIVGSFNKTNFFAGNEYDLSESFQLVQHNKVKNQYGRVVDDAFTKCDENVVVMKDFSIAQSSYHEGLCIEIECTDRKADIQNNEAADRYFPSWLNEYTKCLLVIKEAAWLHYRQNQEDEKAYHLYCKLANQLKMEVKIMTKKSINIDKSIGED